MIVKTIPIPTIGKRDDRLEIDATATGYLVRVICNGTVISIVGPIDKLPRATQKCEDILNCLERLERHNKRR